MSANVERQIADAALAAGGDARIDRIASVDARETLERIKDAALLAAGGVNLLGLHAIRDQFGDRWPAKKTRVWEHVELELARKLGPADLSVRVDEVNYLIATANPGAAAQALCRAVLQDVLKFFMGEVNPSDVAVRMVTELGASTIVSAPVDLSRLPPPDVAPPATSVVVEAATPEPEPTPAPAAQRAAGADQEPAAAEWRPPLAGRHSIVELAAPGQRPFDLRLSVEPVWNLKRGLITSFVIDRSDAGAGADAAKLAEVDVATFAYAATLLEEHARQVGPLTLHAPVAFATLAVQSTRQRLVKLTESVRAPMRISVLIEVCGLDAGVPQSRLVEVVGLVRSLCAGVFVRVRPSRAALAAVAGCGARGVAIEAAHLGIGQGDDAARMKAFVIAARALSPNLIIHGLPAATDVDTAVAAGFTHASVAPERAG
ncbi:MAG TPA: hypothetical protein VKU90_11490 [Caulobacteraceae bacterium]|nr:hypothetical protein [Caulobacteraceae bacterium]